MLLRDIKQISGQIRLQTGLHIGAGKDTVEIGGLDQPIIKDPITNAPYIPGSSLKGKMRSLLECAVFASQSKDTLDYIKDGKPCGCGKRECAICALFGPHNPPDKCDPDLGPTRMLVRDSRLSDKFKTMFAGGELPMEIKYENIIHRVKGTAEHPRPLERVPAGVCFDLNIAVKVYEGDKPELLDWVFRGLKLVQLDALGGCSSRGCGQVVFENLKLDDQPFDLNTIAIFQQEKTA